MTRNTKSFVLPSAFTGVMFFSLGFILGINLVLVPVLKGLLEISPAESHLVIAATFIPFLTFGYPAGLTIKKIGHKRTMALSFLMFAIAFGLFIPSASYESLPLFLLTSFISESANAYLRAAVSPYITILGSIDSVAKRISITGICNKLAWPIPPLPLAFLTGKEVTNTTVADLFLPFYVITAVFIALGIIAYMVPLPEVEAVGQDDSEEAAEAYPYVIKKTSIWQFPHLLLGCLALFLYAGVETALLGTLVDYATSFHSENTAMYTWIAPIGIVIGYICSIIFIPKYMSQTTALKICSVLTITGSALVVLTPVDISIYFISFMALGCSLMWPALWPLAMVDLGKLTKSGSSLLIIAMAGSAAILTLLGYLKDISDIQRAYWICLPCFLFILYYGAAGYKIRTK